MAQAGVERRSREQILVNEMTQENLERVSGPERIEIDTPEKQYQKNLRELTKTAEDFVALKEIKKLVGLEVVRLIGFRKDAHYVLY